ncbi:MAG: hypothetical protein WDW38_000625 [Sanguina aurantia]
MPAGYDWSTAAAQVVAHVLTVNKSRRNDEPLRNNVLDLLSWHNPSLEHVGLEWVRSEIYAQWAPRVPAAAPATHSNTSARSAGQLQHASAAQTASTRSSEAMDVACEAANEQHRAQLAGTERVTASASVPNRGSVRGVRVRRKKVHSAFNRRKKALFALFRKFCKDFLLAECFMSIGSPHGLRRKHWQLSRGPTFNHNTILQQLTSAVAAARVAGQALAQREFIPPSTADGSVREGNYSTGARAIGPS